MDNILDLFRASIETPAIALSALRTYRLARLRAQLVEHDIAFCVLVNPVSLRYAVDLDEYQGFQSRIPSQYVFVPAEGPIIGHGISHRHYELIDDYRVPFRLNTFDGGLDLGDQARVFADSLKAFLSELGLAGGGAKVAIEMLSPSITQAVLQVGVHAADADPLVERARSIKSDEEIQCMQHAIAVAEHGMNRMQSLLQAGVSEVELWSVLHQVNMAHKGCWFDGRMLASGPRTNPWLQEASDRRIEAGDLVAFDTDMIGPFGYCADLSRTWLCGPAEPTREQIDVYRSAYEEVQHNIELVKPGMSYYEFGDLAFKPRSEYVAHRYPCVAHGIGMSDEYPKIYYLEDRGSRTYDGIIEQDMTLCIESFTGSEHGGPGVKLEEMVRVTETGCELLTRYPFETRLLGQ